MLLRVLLFSVLIAPVCAHAGEGRYPIAGLTPSQRPAGAPVIRDVARAPQWKARFFYGVAKPYPPSLAWAEDQGAWYTPFDRPGGTAPPYDIRNWGQSKGKDR